MIAFPKAAQRRRSVDRAPARSIQPSCASSACARPGASVSRPSPRQRLMPPRLLPEPDADDQRLRWPLIACSSPASRSSRCGTLALKPGLSSSGGPEGGLGPTSLRSTRSASRGRRIRRRRPLRKSASPRLRRRAAAGSATTPNATGQRPRRGRQRSPRSRRAATHARTTAAAPGTVVRALRAPRSSRCCSTTRGRRRHGGQAELATGADSRRRVVKLAVPLSELTRSPSITRQMPISGSPTLVLIDRAEPRGRSSASATASRFHSASTRRSRSTAGSSRSERADLLGGMDTLAFEHHLTSPQGQGARPADDFTVIDGRRRPAAIRIRFSVSVVARSGADAGFDADGCGSATAAGSAAVTLVARPRHARRGPDRPREIAASSAASAREAARGGARRRRARPRARRAPYASVAAASAAGAATARSSAMSGGVDSAVAALLAHGRRRRSR